MLSALLSTHSRPGSRRPIRRFLVILLVPSLLGGCAETKPAQDPEGTVAFRSGAGAESASRTHVVPGPAFQRPGILVPAYEPVWQSAWLEKDAEHPLVLGASSGLLTSLSILQIAPGALAFWPAAVGIVVGSAAMGMLGVVQQGDPATPRMSPPDRTVIAQATTNLRPDRLFRDAMAEALARRVKSPLPTVAWHQSWGADTAGTDPLVEARAKGLDGVLEFTLDAIGLAAGDEKDTFGVFVQVRVRASNARDGQLVYERVLSYGPGQTVQGLPRADYHTVEFLALDGARTYQYLASQAIARMARLLAEDPALPIVQ